MSLSSIAIKIKKLSALYFAICSAWLLCNLPIIWDDMHAFEHCAEDQSFDPLLLLATVTIPGTITLAITGISMLVFTSLVTRHQADAVILRTKFCLYSGFTLLTFKIGDLIVPYRSFPPDALNCILFTATAVVEIATIIVLAWISFRRREGTECRE